METVTFHNDAPILNYCQKSLNSFCFGIFASDFVITKQSKAYNAISLSIEEYLKSEAGNGIGFANAILRDGKKR